ncbi:hypothetical protein Clacol_005030 [Clathrus columnatus]|uniref:Uncharacterized protein n=1 Tax=Clathrus columnatus TaxID=1419009 RepID=A0AAV5A844_9AGAM|nr:hypothetical protein Clacol_005030 [Clathrus columnatus]
MNASLSSKMRLPVEILHMINTEVHDNRAFDEVHSKWTPIEGPIEITSHINSLHSFLYDTKEKTFLFSRETYRERRQSGKDKYQLTVAHTVSSADLLYRLRCFFPEVYVGKQGWACNKWLWEAGIRHRDSGLILFFDESKCEANVHTVDDGSATYSSYEDVAMFCNDAVQLMDMFFKTIDGKQLLYFHPAVEGRLPAPDEHFLAVPRPTEFFVAEDWQAIKTWYVDVGQPVDIELSFGSLLPRLSYNIDTQRVDAVSSKPNLTDIVSSSFLFYRLLGHYHDDNIGVNSTTPVTSVWQVKLVHKRVRDATLVFMDDCGLFDIQAGGENVKEVMGDIVALVNALLGEKV